MAEAEGSYTYTPFMDFHSFQECAAFCHEFFKDEPLSKEHTHLNTTFNCGPSAYKYIYDIGNAKSRGEKSGAVNKYLSDLLKDAAPFSIALWFLSGRVFKGLFTEIMKRDYKEISDLVVNSKTKSETSSANLMVYKNAVDKFRKNCKELLPDEPFGYEQAESYDIIVPAECQSALAMMLERMIEKRAREFGASRSITKGKGKESYGAHHYAEYYDYLSGLDHTGFLPLTARGANSTGIITEECPSEITNGKEKKGYMLLSTALEQHMRFNDIEVSELAERAKKDHIFNAALEEVKQMRRDSKAQTSRSEYSQQCSNMDIIFNFFIQLRAFGFTDAEDPKTRTKLNTVLYLLGRTILGKKKVSEKLNKIGGRYKALTSFFNATGSKHMPPYAMTESRIYDWVAIFGILKVADIRLMARTPGISTRYFCHFKFSDPNAMKALTTFNQIESAANGDDPDCIYESEHLLHQMLLNKKNSYQSSVGVNANAFSARFII